MSKKDFLFFCLKNQTKLQKIRRQHHNPLPKIAKKSMKRRFSSTNPPYSPTNPSDDMASEKTENI
jgi:hypothetical protein